MSPKGYERTKQLLALQLFEAVEEQSLQETLKLLDHETADPNTIIREKGISPFHLVIGCECSYFAEEATRAFLQRNGDPNVRSEDGLTPVHVAAVWGRTSLLTLLLSCGGDPWIRDADRGLTPLHFALKEKHWEAALIIQRCQLMNRHNRHSEVQISPRFNINLETVVVSAGEMQANYSASPQDNMSPILLSPAPVQAFKGGNNWNIGPLETHDYVGQWCRKEFTPVTSTPTQRKPLNRDNLVKEQSLFNSIAACASPNITSSKNMTPKNVDFGANNLAPVNMPHIKTLPKTPTDVRKKLFMELRKRFNGLKQSFDGSKDEAGKGNAFERKTSFGYFSRKSFSKSGKLKRSDNSLLTVPASTMNDNNKSCTSENVSFVTSRSIDSRSGGNVSYPNLDSIAKSSLENSPVDEVDAVPFEGSADTSVEWIASQSCFSEDMSPDSSQSQTYFTCDEGSDRVRGVHSVSPLERLLDTLSVDTVPEPPLEIPQRPPRRKQLKALNNTHPESIPSNAQSSASYGTIISEEYRYTDAEAGVTLIESHLLTKPVEVPSPSDTESVVSVPHTVISDAPTATSDVSSVPASFCYDATSLRRELVSLGQAVGPITSTTKTVYLRRLYHLKKKKSVPTFSPVPVYSPELQRVLNSDHWEADIMTFANYEMLMSAPFENPDPNRRWREGVAKSSFNYLLLDPRLSQNLPATLTVPNINDWRQFISAVFYVGKGKRSRPYAHLYQAVHLWNKGEKLKSPNSKIQRILDIWRDGHGVVCLHIFQNIIPVEAFTREAALLDALGKNNLVNLKNGEYYGPASTWKIRQKRQLGIYLLYRAMRIFLCEGERQLRPGDID